MSGPQGPRGLTGPTGATGCTGPSRIVNYTGGDFTVMGDIEVVDATQTQLDEIKETRQELKASLAAIIATLNEIKSTIALMPPTVGGPEYLAARHEFEEMSNEL